MIFVEPIMSRQEILDWHIQQMVSLLKAHEMHLCNRMIIIIAFSPSPEYFSIWNVQNETTVQKSLALDVGWGVGCCCCCLMVTSLCHCTCKSVTILRHWLYKEKEKGEWGGVRHTITTLKIHLYFWVSRVKPNEKRESKNTVVCPQSQ